MTTSRTFAVAVVLLVLVARAAAQPQPQPAPVRAQLTIESDERCATPAALAEQVQRRSQRIELVAETGDIPRLRVTIRATSARVRVAELAVEWPDGRRSERTLTAASCGAALEALGLLVAMTLDPAAFGEAPAPGAQAGDVPANGAAPAADPRGAQAAGGAEPGADPDATPAASTGTEPAPSAADTVEARGQRVDAADAGADSASSAPARPAALGIHNVSVGVSAHVVSGPAPRPMPGFGLYALLTLNGAELWAPALELQLERAWTYGVSETLGEADFALDLARLSACPIGVQRGAFAARACLASEIGRLTASGSHSYAPQSHAELWASLGGGLLLGVGLGPAELQAGLGLARPLRRYEFAFRPEVFHRIPALCWEGHLGAGLRFP